MTTYRALVTGGNRGIGRAIVERLAHAGYEVTFTHYRAAAEADNLVRVLRAEGQQVSTCELDLADEQATQRTLHGLLEPGPLQVLVNNARVDPFRRPADMTEMAWWLHNYAVNVVGSYLCIRSLWDAMVGAGFGRILNIASIHAFTASPPVLHAYGATKTAQLNLTRSYATLGGPHGITVNTLAPGMVATALLEARLSPQEIAAGTARIPLGRPATVAEIAEAAHFLIEAGYITGTTLHINGGEYMP